MSNVLDSATRDHPDTDGQLTPTQNHEFLRTDDAELNSAAELALWKRDETNAGYHCLGCANSQALMGVALADADLQPLTA